MKNYKTLIFYYKLMISLHLIVSTISIILGNYLTSIYSLNIVAVLILFLIYDKLTPEDD